MDYINIIKDILYEKSLNNNNILIIIDDMFNILEHFSHIIKYKNLSIHLVILNDDSYLNMKEYIKGEELENKIYLYNDINNILVFNNDNKLNIVNILSVSSLIFLESILNILHKIIDITTLIEIYTTMSNKNIKNIIFKNYIREKITNIKNIGNKITVYVLPLCDYLQLMNSLKEYEFMKLLVYKKNNYFLYGDNIIYKTIIKKNFISEIKND